MPRTSARDEVIREVFGINKRRDASIEEFNKEFPELFERLASAPNETEAAKIIGPALRAAMGNPAKAEFLSKGIQQVAPFIDEARRSRKLSTFADETRGILDEAGAAERTQFAGLRPPDQTQAPTNESIAGAAFTPLRKLEDPLRPQDVRNVQLSGVSTGVVDPKTFASNLAPEGSVAVGGQAGNVPFADLFQQSQQTGRTQAAQAGQTERTELAQGGALERAQIQREGAFERLEKRLGSKEAITELTETGKTERAKLKADEASGLKSTLGTLTGSIKTLMKLQDHPNADDALISNTQVLIDSFLVKASKLDPTIRIEVDPQSGRRVLMRGEQPTIEELPPEEIPAEAERSGLASIPIIGEALNGLFGGGATPSAATTGPIQPIQQTNIQETNLPSGKGLSPEVDQVQQESEQQLRQQLQTLMDQIFQVTGDEDLSRQMLEEAFDEAGGDPNITAQLVQRRLSQFGKQ